ncbi:Fic family protein [Spirillospora sp. NPDC049024]
MSVRYLTAEEIVAVGRRAVGEHLNVRDFGLVASAAARPATVTFGVDPYPTLLEKAAALLHSLTTPHPFTDGNKRVASPRPMSSSSSTEHASTPRRRTTRSPPLSTPPPMPSTTSRPSPTGPSA